MHLLARASELPAGKRRQNLIDFNEQALLSRRLVELDRHMPIEIDWRPAGPAGGTRPRWRRCAPSSAFVPGSQGRHLCRPDGAGFSATSNSGRGTRQSIIARSTRRKSSPSSWPSFGGSRILLRHRNDQRPPAARRGGRHVVQLGTRDGLVPAAAGAGRAGPLDEQRVLDELRGGSRIRKWPRSAKT